MAQNPNILRTTFSRINFICAALGACILFFIATIVCFEVASRAIAGSSRLWVIEVSEYSLLFITFLGAPYLLEKNMHVVLDLVYNNVVGLPKRIIQTLNASIGLAVCAILTYVGVQTVVDQFGSGVREVTVLSPQSYWLTAALPLGMFLMGVQFIDQIIAAVTGREA